MTTAHEILQAAQQHMKDRAKTYDQPGGGRSMQVAVEMFNRLNNNGPMLTEDNGYLFTALAFSNGIDFKPRRAHNFQNLSGMRFGRLSVVGVHENSKSGRAAWLCKCDCGAYCRVLAVNLKAGRQVSCGCYNAEQRAILIERRRTSEEEKRKKAIARKAKYSKTKKYKEAQRRYYERHRDRCIARSAEWSRNNPEVGRAAVRNRRARIKSTGRSHTAKDVYLIGEEQGWLCASCSKNVIGNYHVDHVQPISAGGCNGPENLQLLCPTCNLQKSAKSLTEFLRDKYPKLFVLPLSTSFIAVCVRRGSK